MFLVVVYAFLIDVSVAHAATSRITSRSCYFLKPTDYAHSITEDELEVKQCKPWSKGHSANAEVLLPCYTRMDRGFLSMGCIEMENGTQTFNDNITYECLGLSVKNRDFFGCNYNQKRVWGDGHKTPGSGMCCCITDNCNRVPPSWLTMRSSDEFDLPAWRRISRYLSLALVMGTFWTVVFFLEGYVEGLVASRLSLSVMTPTPAYEDEFNTTPKLSENTVDHTEESTTRKGMKAQKTQQVSKGPETTPQPDETAIATDSTQRKQEKPGEGSSGASRFTPATTKKSSPAGTQTTQNTNNAKTDAGKPHYTDEQTTQTSDNAPEH